MTARLRKTALSVSLALVAALVACSASYTEIPIETPIQSTLDVTPFQRIFIAGFIAGANEDVDANMETVRLLRSQLRNKGIMRAAYPPPTLRSRRQAAWAVPPELHRHSALLGTAQGRDPPHHPGAVAAGHQRHRSGGWNQGRYRAAPPPAPPP